MIEKILSIISELPENGKSVLLIEHNMDAISQVCKRVIFMDAGKPINSGVYFFKLNVNGKTEAVKKCLFLK